MSSFQVLNTVRPKTGKVVPTQAPTPRCLHCVNIGLPSDHWLRSTMDPRSPIVCQVLLNTECLYCHEKGHTVGHCNMKKTIEKQQQKILRRQEFQQSVKPLSIKTHTHGRFDSIYVEEDEQPEMDVQSEVIHIIPTSPTSPTVRTWASVVKQPPVVKSPVQSDEESDELNTEIKQLNQQWLDQKMDMKATVALKDLLFKKRKWTDMFDSDSDSE